MTQKRWDEMSEEERVMLWTSSLTDDEMRDLGVPKFSTLGGLRIQNWASEEDEYEFFQRRAASRSPLRSRERRALQRIRLRRRGAMTRSPDVISVAASRRGEPRVPGGGERWH